MRGRPVTFRAPRDITAPAQRPPAFSLIRPAPMDLAAYRDVRALARAIHRELNGRGWRLVGDVSGLAGYDTAATVQVYAMDPNDGAEQWIGAAIVEPDPARVASRDGKTRGDRDVRALHDALQSTLNPADLSRLGRQMADAA